MIISFIRKIIIALFSVLIVYLFYMQCVRGEYYQDLAKMNRIRLLPLSGPRGNIYDRDGNLLAGNRLAFDCVVMPQEFYPDHKALEELGRLLNKSASVLKDEIRENTIAPFVPMVIKDDVAKELAIAISEKSLDLPGLLIQTRSVRYYPHKNMGSHVIGYLGKINEDELYALSDYGYKAMDHVGRGGLESFYDSYLKGEEGGIQAEVDSRGRELRQLGIKEPEKGKDITTTIDLELEAHIDSLMEGERGAAIVMSSETGEILALVSKPDFDPNIFVSALKPDSIKILLGRSDYPMIDRAISGAYPPGSVFKLVTSSAALDMKRMSLHDQLNCPGFYMLGKWRFNCWKDDGHGTETIIDGIKNSCNVFFYQVGRKAGVDGLAAYAVKYGMGRNSGIDLPYESAGTVPTRAWKLYRMRQSWFEGDTVNYAIGQGYLLVTPIQILRMTNAVGTEGILVKPFLVRKIGGLEVKGAERRRLDISKETFRTIKEGMKRAVDDPSGTAKAARAKGLSVAGKTGTAEAGPKGTHAWFTGFSPADKPQFSLVVFLEYGGKGGDKPAKMASSIFAKLKELGYL
ncbi:MAG: penicillin-binding protein 2 [Candidatus Omnitrophica bacterium]|nr:penicillin-binding protein 2 [Candidatus Omnitrophota bacterium]MBU4487993.1 penicillin-binding protein 2 [Candidatus Omnitrophota bacterium]MCG2704764.1 penicillin-binding protein 2 [Candidatus Omnitrophota bacterium]